MRLDEKIALEKEEAAEKAAKKALAKGIELGKKEAEKDATLKIAKNLKSMNYSIEEIPKVTGLTLEEVEKL